MIWPYFEYATDTVAVFKMGQLLELASTSDIFSKPRSTYTRQPTGTVSVVDTTELAL